jgi:hypothetical protein
MEKNQKKKPRDTFSFSKEHISCVQCTLHRKASNVTCHYSMFSCLSVANRFLTRGTVYSMIPRRTVLKNVGQIFKNWGLQVCKVSNFLVIEKPTVVLNMYSNGFPPYRTVPVPILELV